MKTTHKVSATYCPDGRKYEWLSDGRGATLIYRVLRELESRAEGEWVDVSLPCEIVREVV